MPSMTHAVSLSARIASRAAISRVRARGTAERLLWIEVLDEAMAGLTGTATRELVDLHIIAPVAGSHTFEPPLAVL